MIDSRNKPVRIPASSERPTLSVEQRKFNDLMARLGKQRARMVAWEAATSQYHRKYTSEWLPAARTLADLRIDLARRLDEAGCEAALNKNERRLIAELIVDIVKELLWERDDAELKALYNRHSGSDYDADKAAAAERRNALLEDTFGIEAGSLDDVIDEADAEILRSKQDADERDAREDSRARRKTTPRQRALEAQRESDALHASQSIREVYRKLASALHPDRETDPVERSRKTALMQRVNQAYAEDDLLRLFELQLELEHIDRNGLSNVSGDRLKHYNRVLAEQLRELTLEIKRVEEGFRDRFGLPPSRTHSPKTILRQLRDEIADIGRSIVESKRELRTLGDIQGVKRWLAHARRARTMPRFDDMPF